MKGIKMAGQVKNILDLKEGLEQRLGEIDSILATAC